MIHRGRRDRVAGPRGVGRSNTMTREFTLPRIGALCKQNPAFYGAVVATYRPYRTVTVLTCRLPVGLASALQQNTRITWIHL